MTKERSEASGVDQEVVRANSALTNQQQEPKLPQSEPRDFAGEVLSGTMDVGEALRLLRAEYDERQRDIARLDWLEAHGRVDTWRGDSTNTFTWDSTHGLSLRSEIDKQMSRGDDE